MKEILLTSSVLIGVVMVLRWLLRGKVRQRLLYATWLLVALRLLIPIQFGQWSFSLNTLTETVTEHSETLQQALQVLQAPVAGPTEEQLRQQLTQQYLQQGLDLKTPEVQIQLETQVQTQKAAPTVSEILRILWLTGVAVMALWFLLTNLIFMRRARIGSRTLVTDVPVPVRVSSGVPTPSLVGLFRPVIYVTPDCIEDPQMLRHVLTHEIAHLRQWDPLWSLVRCVCLCIYWFNPLVWLAAAQSRRDCELSCDESALKLLGDEERVAYGKTLLAMIRRSSAPSELLKTATSMNESKKQLKERMCFIVKKPRNLLIAAIAMVLIIAVAAGCAFTGGKNPKGPEQTQSPPIEPQETQPTTAPLHPEEVLYPVPAVHEGLVPTLVREDIYFVYNIKILPENCGVWKCPEGLQHSLRIPQLSLDGPNVKAFNEKLWAKYSQPLRQLSEGTEGSAIFLCDFQWTVSDEIISIVVYEGIGQQMGYFHSTALGYYYDCKQDKELTFEEYLLAMGTSYDEVLTRVRESESYRQTDQTATEITDCLICEDRVLAIFKDDITLKGWLSVETAPIGRASIIQFPEPTELYRTVFRKDTTQEELIGRWIAHVDIYGEEYDRYSYTLELREDGTAEYSWGIWGSDLLERLEGTWKPGEEEGTYVLDLTFTGGVRFENFPPYDLTAIQQLRCSEDGTALQARWCGATQLFHFYKKDTLVLYRYDDDAKYYEIPMQSVS